jgi:hypothetical protein
MGLIAASEHVESEIAADEPPSSQNPNALSTKGVWTHV